MCNTLRPRQNGRHFAYNMLNCIFLYENMWIPIKISLMFVPKGPINNIPALVQIMAWHWSGDKPLSKPMMASLLTHICITRRQCVEIRYAAPVPITGTNILVPYLYVKSLQLVWRSGSRRFQLLVTGTRSSNVLQWLDKRRGYQDNDPSNGHWETCSFTENMMSSNGNILRITVPLCGEFTGHQWIPHTKASDAELWCFLWSAPCWVNNREAGDLRCHHAHYNVIVKSLVKVNILYQSVWQMIKFELFIKGLFE